MALSPQGNGWAGATAAHDELAVRLRQLALRAGAGSDPSNLMSTGVHSPALASEHLLSQARQNQFYQGSRVQGMHGQPGVSVKSARLPLGVRGVPTSVPAFNTGLIHSAPLGAGRMGYSAARPWRAERNTASTSQGIMSPGSQQHNQAALLALVQNQLAAAQKQQQVYAGTIPAVPSMVQQALLYGRNPIAATAKQANVMATAAATAAVQAASMQNAASLTGGGLQPAGVYAPSLMATAPMLPILGGDLAKPNVHSSQGLLPGLAPGGLHLMQATPSALQSAASLESSSIKSCDTGMTPGSTAVGSVKLTWASGSHAQKLYATEGTSTSAPLAPLDLSTQTQAQVDALAQTEEINVLAAQFGLLGRPGYGASPVSGGPVAGIPASNIGPSGAGGGGARRERDMNTLKTLGQMLARTGNTVESAVQTGLLGGCNAEDVKVVWEAYAVQLAGVKEANSLRGVWSMDLPKERHLGTSVLPASNPVAQPIASGNVGGVIGDKRDVSSQQDDSPVMLQPATASTVAENPIMPSISGSLAIQPTKEEEEEEQKWDEVFENEEKLVPSHVISAVNDSTGDLVAADLKMPSEGIFNSCSHGFFGNISDCGGELLEGGGLEALQMPEGDNSDTADGKQNSAVWETLAWEGGILDTELVEVPVTACAEKNGTMF